VQTLSSSPSTTEKLISLDIITCHFDNENVTCIVFLVQCYMKPASFLSTALLQHGMYEMKGWSFWLGCEGYYGMSVAVKEGLETREGDLQAFLT
jgi:hypothetical protein